MVLEKFIVLEGIDGSGTSTQLQKLAHYFESNQMKFKTSCEPTSNEIGKLIRKILKGKIKVEIETLTKLFLADRHEHIYGENGILNLHNQGYWVISDRYHFSTLAYQSTKINMQELYLLNKDFPLPSHLFYLNIDASLANQRVSHRNEMREIYETVDQQQLISNNYQKAITLFKDNKMKITQIDATKPIKEVTQLIIEKLLQI